MPDTPVLLTIAIPTYNRNKYLRELLPVMLAQVNSLPPEYVVEVLVIDNASPDNTAELLSEYRRSYNNLRCLRNDVNIGGDPNFYKCIEEARGRYVWLFGDDEVLLDGAVGKVSCLLNDNKPALMLVGDGAYGKLLSSMIFEDYGDFMATMLRQKPHFLIAHTLITANVFLRDKFNLKRARELVKTNYGHMYGLTPELKGRGKVYVSIEPIFKVREQRATFAHQPRFLRLKLSRYLYHLGNVYGSPAARKYAFGFYLDCVLDDILIKLPRRILSAEGFIKYRTLLKRIKDIMAGKR